MKVLTRLLPAPTLTSYRGANGSLTFAWPIDYSGFVLESNTNLNSNAWVPVPMTTELSVAGGYYVVSSNPDVPQNFYRLRSP